MAIREEEMQTVGGEREANLPKIEIRPLEKGEDTTAFRTLNEEWITRYFTLEKMDRTSGFSRCTGPEPAQIAYAADRPDQASVTP